MYVNPFNTVRPFLWKEFDKIRCKMYQKHIVLYMVD